MVEPITFQVIFQFLQTISIMVGIAYYLMILQNQQNTNKQTLEARRNDIFLRHYGSDSEAHVNSVNEIRDWEWNDYEDWKTRYKNVPEKWAKYAITMQRYNGLGLLAKSGHVDLDMVYQYTPMPIIGLWERFEEVIKESRKDPGFYEHYNGLEFLYNEMKKRTTTS